MNVYECIRSRLTVREFKADPVPNAVVTKLLRAARWAPSSRNRQPWHFVVIQNKEMLRKIGGIASSGRYIGEAPLAIAVVMDNVNRAEIDAGRVIQQIELTAWSEGLGGCFVGLKTEEQGQIKELLAIPADMQLITVMPFGFPADKALARTKQRKLLSEIAYREMFGHKYEVG